MHKKYFFIVIFFLFNFNLVYAQDNQNYERFWVQYSDQNSLLFRYINEDNNQQCPLVIIDNRKYQTTERTHYYQKEFPIKLCQREFDNKKPHKIEFNNIVIHSKLKNLEKISMIGDTGNVIEKKYKVVQNANNINEYPFPLITQNIAKHKPDLIIHLGDYFYSSTKSHDKKICAGRPFGDQWATWRMDFMDNAQPLFKSAPIIFTRGNHETCKRGGKGWAVIFDPSIKFKNCSKYTSPYNISFRDINFLMLDSSAAEDFNLNKDKLSEKEFKEHMQKNITSYIKQFNQLAYKINNSKNNILITHRPIYSLDFRAFNNINKNKLGGANQTFCKIVDREKQIASEVGYSLSQAIEYSKFKYKLKNIQLIVSGHTHNGMYFKLKDHNSKNYFIQIVSGNGGAFRPLGNIDLLAANHRTLNQYQIIDRFQDKSFGFSEIIIKKGAIQKVNFYNNKDNLLKICKL